MRRRLRTEAAALLAVLAATGLVLRLTGGGHFAPPSLVSPPAWASWLDEVGPFAGAVAVVRLVALGLWWYLTAASACGIALRLAGADGLVAVADRFTLPGLRRLLATGVAGLTLSVPVAPLAWASPPDGRGLPGQANPAAVDEIPKLTMRLLEPVGATGADSSRPTAPSSVEAAGSDEAPPARAPTNSPAATVNPDTAVGNQAPRARGEGGSRSWTVEPGESFWSRAEAVVAAGSDRATGAPAEPPEAAVAPYWVRLVEANRLRLADPGNPDLIFAGQVFVLPER